MEGMELNNFMTILLLDSYFKIKSWIVVNKFFLLEIGQFANEKVMYQLIIKMVYYNLLTCGLTKI